MFTDRSSWRPRRIGAAGLVLTSTLGLAVLIVVLQGQRPSTAPSVLLGNGSGRFSSETATDWVAHADHVVVVMVDNEEPIPAAEDDVLNGEGIILRDLQLRVVDVLWSSDRPRHEVPGAVSWTGVGWQFKQDLSVPMATRGTSRLEVGHRYLMPILWVDEDCTSSVGRWSGLDGESVLPFDDSVVGNGEFEGREVDVSQFRKAVSATPYGFRTQVIGESGEALVARLRSVAPEASDPTPNVEDCE